MKHYGVFRAMNFFADKDMAARYQVSRQTVWRWVREGRFPKPIRLGAAAIRWSEEDILKWEQEKKAEAVK